MGKTLSEIEQMPESHLQEYELFYREQPFGIWRDDYRTAQISHLLAMINSDPKKSPLKLDDFMPFFKKEMTAEEDELTNDDGSAEYLANR